MSEYSCDQPEAGRDGGEYLRYQSVKVSVGRGLDTQVVLTEVINGYKHFVVYNHK